MRPRPRLRNNRLKAVLLEALLIAFIGGLLALAGNAVSPRGISLTQDFFHTKDSSHAIASKNLSPTNASSATSAIPPTVAAAGNDLAATLKQEGLGLINTDRAFELLNDPRRLQNLVVFIDARHDEEYKAGHIPGAYQFDYYYRDRFLGTVVPVIRPAELVIVYCNGGDCTDSHYAALELSNFIPRAKLMVYAGGITEWKAMGHEIETGERNSGVLAKPQ